MLFSKVHSVAVAALVLVDSTLAQDKYPVTGPKGGIVNNLRPPRREIRELVTNSIEYSLIIQALNQLMEVPESNMLSYFSVAGIHGRPYQQWDGVGPTQPPTGDANYGGYCPHGNVVFGTWHRPYLSLYEQLMSEKAQAIAATYNNQTWITAAAKVRLPYWDWAATPKDWPYSLISEPNVSVATPTGPKTVPNPFATYKFKGQPYPANIFPNDYLGTQKQTLRQPNQETNTTGDAQIASWWALELGGIERNIWSVFAQTKVFNRMTTSSDTSDPNLEGYHGMIHLLVGGHLAPSDYAAFDPLFLLHHANVDRQIAMWQAINPNSYVEPQVSVGGTWTIPAGSVVNGDTPLTPFSQANRRNPHTSFSVRNIENFGYSYADIPSTILSGAALAANVTARVNQLYNPTGSLVKRTKTYSPRRNAGAKRSDSPTQWSIHAKVPNDATGQGFRVRFTFEKEQVGQIGVLNAPSAAEVALGIKKTTMNAFALPDLGDVADVKAAIRAGLSWTVINSDGTKVPLAEVKGLKVTISERTVTPAEDETSFPQFGPRVFHPDILA